jgi:HEAT repeats
MILAWDSRPGRLLESNFPRSQHAPTLFEMGATSDPRLQPTPDYGTLGPGSDLRSGQPIRPAAGRGLTWIAVLAGALLALPVLKIGSLQELWEKTGNFLIALSQQPPRANARSSTTALSGAPNQTLQRQAESLLEAAIARAPQANDRIAERADSWRGQIAFTQDLNARIAAALDSNDYRVRESAVEVDLAAYNIAKTPASVDNLIHQANSANHATSIWALWTLGLLGNRGIETDRVVEALSSHLKDSNADSRRWAVEGLALVGTDATIQPLLQTFHDDPSPMVRERAACSLAQSGMLRPEQRRAAVPQILTYADDPALDHQTQAWAFHALRDITGQSLPDNAAAWREWFSHQ